MPESLCAAHIQLPCRPRLTKLKPHFKTSLGVENMKRLTPILIFLISFQAHAIDWKENNAIGKLFASADVVGTFVLFDVAANQFVGHDKARAEQRFIPASTFKIPNTLIGLSVGAVKSVDEILPYGGKPQPFKTWEKDMGLREAITLSNVAIYQELARRIGIEQMQEGVLKLGYGNKNIGTQVDTFWLRGPLQISAVEQTQFLAKLAHEALPFPREHQEKTREIILLEKNADYALYGKTGWENAPNSGVGWWVGWVQKDNRIYAFALNIDIRNSSDVNKRVELGKESLKLLGVL